MLDPLPWPNGHNKVLLRSCCALCSGEVMEAMRASGINFTIFFYNPNMHMENEPERGIRCTICIDMCFKRTALYAHEHGFPIITSSLGISRWKNIQQINDCGIHAASHYPDLIYWDYNWRKKGGSARMMDFSNSISVPAPVYYMHSPFSTVGKELMQNLLGYQEWGSRK